MIEIFGLGECGSTVTFSLFEQLYPRRSLFTSDQARDTTLVATLWRWFDRSPRDPDQGTMTNFEPRIYIGDLNKDNRTYRKYLQAQAISECLESAPRMNAADRLAKCRERLEELALAELDDHEFQNLYDAVSQRVDAGRTLKLLEFRDPPTTASDGARDGRIEKRHATDGAGGNQIYSELATIAFGLPRLIQPRHEQGVLLGVFALGGGTGAGAATAIFKNIDRAKYTYTMGIGVLPDDLSVQHRARAGRFITNYMKQTTGRRADSLVLISNEAAMNALRAWSSLNPTPADGQSIDQEAEPEETFDFNPLVNQYAYEMIVSLLLLKGRGLRVVTGKQFDYSDFHARVRGLVCLGYCAVPVNRGNPHETLWGAVTQALSPMTLSRNRRGSGQAALRGLSVDILRNSEPTAVPQMHAAVSNCLSGIWDDLQDLEQLEQFDESGCWDRIAELNDTVSFYSTIKACTVLIFVPPDTKLKDVDVVGARLSYFFRSVTGQRRTLAAAFEISFNVYEVPNHESLAVLVLPSCAYMREIFECVRAFTVEGFGRAENGDNYLPQADELQDAIVDCLDSSNEATTVHEASQAVEVFRRRATAIVSGMRGREEVRGLDSTAVQRRLGETPESIEKCVLTIGDCVECISRLTPHVQKKIQIDVSMAKSKRLL